MANTVIFCVVVVFFRVLLGLAIAYALNSKLMKHKTLFRTIFYMPTVTPLVAVAYVWKIMYNPQFGLIDNIFGLDINWLFDSSFALPAPRPDGDDDLEGLRIRSDPLPVRSAFPAVRLL